MNKKILLCLLCLTIISCNKKEDNSNLLSKYIQIDKVINTGCEYKGGRTSFLIALYKDDVYMKPQLTGDGLRINVYNQKNKKMIIKHFKLHKSINDTLKHYSEPYDIEVTNQYIYTLFIDYLIVIDKYNSDNTYLTNLKEPFQSLKVFGNDLFLSRAFDFSPEEGLSPIRIAKYDLKTKRITKVLDPISDAYEFSYVWPFNWFDISNTGDVAFTQAISPEQSIYNYNLEYKEKLFYKPKNWKNVDMTELNYIRKEKLKLSPQEISERLVKTDDGRGSRIVSVNFANDSTLLVFYTSPNLNEKAGFVRYCNIWKRKNDKWVLFDKQLKDAYPELSSTLSKGNFPFSGSMQKVRFVNNKAYYIFVSPNEDKLLQFGKKFSVVKKEMNRHFAEDRIFHQLYIYKCKF
jgi:hypothetical protein